MADFLVEMHFEEDFGLDHRINPHDIPVIFSFAGLDFPLEFFCDFGEDIVLSHWIMDEILLRLMTISFVLVLTLPKGSMTTGTFFTFFGCTVSD